jgi:hypothetical protein
MSDDGTVRLWVRWYSAAEMESVDNPWPIWRSGWAADETYSIYCALIDAPLDECVISSVEALYPDARFTSVLPRHPNWEPGDRFPMPTKENESEAAT